MLTVNVVDMGKNLTPSPRKDIEPLFKPSQTIQAPSQNNENSYMIKRNADNMLRQNHTSGLHEMLLD